MSRAAPKAVLFVGSSIFREWEQLSEQMAPLPILNNAVSGSRTWDWFELMNELVLPCSPQMIVYYCGSNDVYFSGTAESISAGFFTFEERVRHFLPDIKFVYASILKAPEKRSLWEVVEGANALVRSFCAKHSQRARFVDLNPAVFDEAGAVRCDLYQLDGTHYKPAAYVAFSQILKPVLEEEWKKLRGVDERD